MHKQLLIFLLFFALIAMLLPVVPTAAQEPPARQEGIIQEPGGFIRAEGPHLVRFGQVVRIKGANYYPRRLPWREMWTDWDSVRINEELRIARDLLGINAVRILLPYDAHGEGNVDADLIRKLQEFLQIAGNYDMRVIVTLFDFYDGFPAAHEGEWQANVRYVEQLVGAFRGDERILAWDLHNEPDHYTTWTSGNAPRVLDWLGRMADVVHGIAPNHLVTVGMGQYINLYQHGPDGRRVVDYSDVISVHNYNAPDAVRQLDEVRAHTGKPILLQEFGWPSGPACVVRDYNEGQQAAVYQQMLAAAEGRTAGVFSWSLFDFDVGPTMRWDTREEHYGLIRADNTLKPAAQTFAAYPAAPLPSITKTNLELRSKNHHIEGNRAPKLIPESGHYVKGWFRTAWHELGGMGSFGPPLSEAYVNPNDGRVIQHFAAATLEFDGTPTHEPGFDQLPPAVQAMRTIRPVPIGRIYTQGIQFPPQPPLPPGAHAVYIPETGYAIQGAFLDFYLNFYGDWRLGKPISPEVVENINGVDVTIQYFENGRLEWHPVYNAVQFGQIGQALWERQCRFE